MLEKFEAYQIAVQFYRACEGLEAAPHLREQLLRAASSIALNLAEGSSRPTEKDRTRFFSIALGSLRECQATFQLARIDHLEATALADRLGGYLYRLTFKKTKSG